MAINTADIHAAADALAAQGKRPTLAAVRATLGGGSFSTIGEALKTWHKPDSEQAKEKAPVPAAISEGAARMAAALWAQAQEHSQQVIQAAQEELEQQRQAMETVRQEATEAADALAAHLAEARQELETLRKELVAARERLAATTDRAQQAEAQAVQARAAETAARIEAAELRGRLEAGKPAEKQTKPRQVKAS